MTHLILLLALMQQAVSETVPIDVPAIEYDVIDSTEMVNCHAASKDPKCHSLSVISSDPKCSLVECDIKNHTHKGWTCSDKTHILMHDEQDPPKWYCHKPQTGGTE